MMPNDSECRVLTVLGVCCLFLDSFVCTLNTEYLIGAIKVDIPECVRLAIDIKKICGDRKVMLRHKLLKRIILL
jgi:hypothetical protein